MGNLIKKRILFLFLSFPFFFFFFLFDKSFVFGLYSGKDRSRTRESSLGNYLDQQLSCLSLPF
jgi:hypothetical protein